ncbi:FAD-dependent monooxygenase [Anaeromyxobacter oryzae]|uniref:Oxygenase n=1 Tax=Anaeromyxobacter oryzae TaxID=2918170 RepID=A0ABM7WQ96_9BACT|nr:FAD-dependent monooxygenase [Anaeromyxobacter oryzae]BDG01637.1 oxygenase [Anaeromyxobacter oryzae]
MGSDGDESHLDEVAVLVVGAGPTGLALAAQLRWLGVRTRIIDRSLDRAHESRALAVQARTLEVLDALGLAEPLVARGNTSSRLVIHLGARRIAEARLGRIGATDTRYPFILFVSQSETERVLEEYLAGSGVAIERGVELVRFEVHERWVQCELRHPGGGEERVRATYLVGCDGAHSTVRKGAGFSFGGGSYPEDFVLGDVEADGPLEPGAINSFVGGGGVAMFFPLGDPATWRVIAMQARDPGARRDEVAPDDSPAGPLTLEELQAVVATPTSGSILVRDPAWLSHFRLHHRQIAQYRRGRVLLAGDAAHIHSPVGGQGMNTGIQDAWNLGWKLALVARGTATERLLESYDAERWPVGRNLLRYTDRVFSTFTRALSAGRLASWAREVVAPRVLPRLLDSGWLRAMAFRFVSELGIRYRHSPAVTEGRPRLHGGPRAGDRLPDAWLTLDGRRVALQRAIVGPHLTLLLCGEAGAWDVARLERFSGLVKLRHLPVQTTSGAETGAEDVLSLLGVRDAAQYLVRPDGYIAFRCGGSDLEAVTRYLTRWFRRPAANATG